MNSGLSHKMYNYEVPPPSGVWEFIAAELDETELSKTLSSKLYNIQSVPPAGIWEAIAITLDNSLPVNSLAERLHNTEIEPPANAWSKIVAELDEVSEAAIPDRRKLSPFIRYAAAASIIGLLAFGALQLFKNKGADDNTEIVKAPVITPEKINTTSPAVKEETTTIPAPQAIAEAEEVRNDAALEASKRTYAKLDKPVSAKMDMAAAFYFNEAVSTGSTRGLDDMFTINEEQPVSGNINSRYIMLMTPDGNIIRMSKKLSDLVCCVSGEEQDDDCMHQLKQWKDKMANAYAGHSPGNFMDILSLVSSLQDNNN